MQVIKRDGRSEYFNFDKVEKVIHFACENEEQVKEFINDLEMQLKNNITTEEIQKTLIRLAVDKVSIDEPHWQYVASKLFAYDLYKKAGNILEYKKFGYPNYKKFVYKMVEEYDLYGSYILDEYSDEELEQIGDYIDIQRDGLLEYSAIKTLHDKYLKKGKNREILELPQHRFMAIAVTLAIPEKKSERLNWIKKFYDVLSQREIMTATPTILNSGMKHRQLSSCFQLNIDDDLWSIYDVNKNAAQLSKYSGGIGLYGGRIRSRGSSIQNVKDASNGVIPWIKTFNSTAVAVDQLGSRPAGISFYLDVWHPDILEFLEGKTNTGEERLKFHDIFPALCIPDLFMKKVEERGDWFLIDSKEIHDKKGYYLEDYYGEEWEDKYIELCNDLSIRKYKISAIEIMKRFIKSVFETGTPFIFFRDAANRDNPNKHTGMIYSTQLCTEIKQNTGFTKKIDEYVDENGVVTTKKQAGDVVVCVLSSLNLGKIDSENDLKRIIPIQIRMLDNVIDMNYYPIKEAEYTNKRYRSIAAGVMSYHEYMVKRGIKWESEEHLEEADRLFEKITYYTLKASMELAKERGAYPLFEGSEWSTGEYFNRKGYIGDRWDELKNEIMKNGLRNGYLQAIAPTASISVLSGTTAMTDPIYSKLFMEQKKEGMVPQLAPSLDEKTFWLYKEAHTIDQNWSIKACGVRAKWLDQGNSFNLYITQDTKAKDILDYYLNAWKCGLKSVYYVRSKTLTVEECVSCQ